MSLQKEYITIIDIAGRNILGTLSSGQSADQLIIDNPVVIAVQPQQGQIQVQMVPLFLSEFVEPDSVTGRSYSFAFPRNQTVIGKNFKIIAKVIDQYDRIMAGLNVPAKTQTDKPEVIKLFED